jgi:RimJ/RimL family protein N-acetyltransferase
LRTVFDYLLVRSGRHRVFCSVDPHNLPSIALLERIGMRKEGHFVESLRFKGAWVDDLIFAMLAREWPVTEGGE